MQSVRSVKYLWNLSLLVPMEKGCNWVKGQPFLLRQGSAILTDMQRESKAAFRNTKSLERGKPEQITPDAFQKAPNRDLVSCQGHESSVAMRHSRDLNYRNQLPV